MGVREYLDTIKSLDNKVELTKIGIEWVKRNIKYQGETEEYIKQIEGLENDIKLYIEELTGMETYIIRKILDIKDYEYQMVIIEREMMGKTWEEIAEDNGYVAQTLRNKHKKALVELSRLMEYDNKRR